MNKKQKPAFFNLASAVVQSPYFYETIDGEPQTVITFSKKRREEKKKLVDALDECKTEKDLRDEAKKIWDRAMQSLREAADESDTAGRVQGDTSYSIKLSPRAQKVRQAAPPDAEMVLAAMIQAMENGDKDAAKKLVELMKTPEKIHELSGIGQTTVATAPKGHKDDTKEKSIYKGTYLTKSGIIPKNPTIKDG